MLTRKQQRELEMQKGVYNKNNSSKNTSLSSELQEGVLVEMLEILDQKNQIQVEVDYCEPLIDPQLKRIEDYNNYYKAECLQQLTFEQMDLSQCLANHKIREWVRGKMVDWMVEVFAEQSFDSSFFRAINLMDGFLRYSYNYSDSDMYLIGITCIFIASKIEDIYHISIQTVSKTLSHNKYTEFQIKEQESIILETLNYDTNFPTHYDILQFLHYQLFGLSNNQFVQIIQETSIYILKMCFHDYGVMQYKQILLSTCILGYTIQTFIDQHTKMTNQLQKMLQQTQHNLLKISMIELVDYMECLQKVDELIQNFNYKYPQYENLRRFY